MRAAEEPAGARMCGVTEPALPSSEPRTGQIAFVVADLRAAIDGWIALGVAPWNVWTFDESMLRVRTFKDEPGQFAAKVALCSVGPLTYELVEPTAGPSIWDGFLDGAAARPHHLGYYVDDIDDAIRAMAAQGFAAIQTGAGFGVDGDGAFAYFDTVGAFGCYFEAIASPRALPDPEARYPAG
jgi:methylmalonyl-CoA/ethylmalonyl-CoA epimerase